MAVGDPYLQSHEYAKYGLDPETTHPDIVWQACLLIDIITNHTESRTRLVDGTVNGLWRGEYEETRRLPADRNKLTVIYKPAQALVSIKGRITPGRRSEMPPMMTPDVAMILGPNTGVPKWIDIDPLEALLDPDGTLWVPQHPYYGCTYNEVSFVYEAGFDVIPEHIKMAVAWLVRDLPRPDDPLARANLREIQEGDQRIAMYDTTFVRQEIYNMVRNEVAVLR